jgi:hypothetical protein
LWLQNCEPDSGNKFVLIVVAAEWPLAAGITAAVAILLVLLLNSF